MKKTTTLLFLSCFSVFCMSAQVEKSELSVIQSVANKILSENSFLIVDKSSGKEYEDLSKLPDEGDFSLKSKY
jgi:hypothetical protein